MDGQGVTTCTAFEGDRRVASGTLVQVAQKAKEIIDRDGQVPVLIFDDSTSEIVEVDFRGTMEDVLKRLGKPASSLARAAGGLKAKQSGQRKPGRPRLGVVSREITLLPRHWDWLNRQPGGASVALRKLVEEARRVNSGRDRVRRSQEVAYRFMSAMAGNLPGFEEATRALFAGNPDRFEDQIAGWTGDIRDHARKLAGPAFQKRGCGSE